MLTSAHRCFYQRPEENVPGRFHQPEGAERQTAASAFSQQPLSASYFAHLHHLTQPDVELGVELGRKVAILGYKFAQVGFYLSQL